MKVLLLVVLYKVEPDCADTLRSLAEQSDEDDFSVFVWDNSPLEATANQKAWLSERFTHSSYHHDGKNTSLSDIYNSVINGVLLTSRENYEYFILLDQDTVLKREYLSKMRRAAEQNPDVHLFLPIVKASGKIVSPGRLYYFKGVYWNAIPGRTKSRFTTAINSGMMISRSYLAHQFPGYPEELKFYGTDNYLCQTLARTSEWMCVVDTTVEHDLSQFRVESAETKLWRHWEIMRATRYLNRQGFIRRNLCYLYTSAQCLREAIRYRDWRFFRAGQGY